PRVPAARIPAPPLASVSAPVPAPARTSEHPYVPAPRMPAPPLAPVPAPVPTPASRPRDRTNPSIAEIIRHDPTQPLSAEVRALAANELARWSRRVLLPIARVLSLLAVALMRCAKAVLPDVLERRLRWHRGIDLLCVGFIRRFMSADAAALLARHF